MNEKNKRRDCFTNTVTGLIVAGLSLVASQSVGQEINVGYVPPAGPGATEVDYNKGKYILENTYQSIKDHDGKIVYADLWNVGTAYSYMGVDHDVILQMFRASKRMDADRFGSIVAHATNGKDQNEYRLFKLLGQPFRELVRDCNLEIKPTTLAQRMEEKSSSNLNGLNEELIDQLLILMDKDQRFRYSTTSYEKNWEAQNKLDDEVQSELAELFDKHGYPGQTLVGEKYAGYASLLLEHGGDLEHQDEYFSLVKEAFKNGELPRGYLQMLTDRIHWKKTKKQIFGSHIGIPFDSEEVIQQTKRDLGW